MSLKSISPIDGRYAKNVGDLAEYVSEFALMYYRVYVEVEWIVFLCEEGLFGADPISDEQITEIREIYKAFDENEALRISEIERKTNHDVKAVEYFIREDLLDRGFELDYQELVHIACTSEDINNLAYALMLDEVRKEVFVPAIEDFLSDLADLAVLHANTPMLSRTHGQNASPTTLGKELAVFQQRIKRWFQKFESVTIYGKFNGAVGNFSAHSSADPEVDWIQASEKFVARLGLETQSLTTQIEPHDWMAEYAYMLSGLLQPLLDFNRDIWTYISMDYFKLKQVDSEVGSSTMPHKVNPIDFENSEGNIGVATALLQHVALKLPVSRMQRDLSDSTVQRNLGTAFGHVLIAIKSATRGLSKLEVNQQQLKQDLDLAWEVLAEPLQVALRMAQVPGGYDLIKSATRGAKINQKAYTKILEDLPLSTQTKHRLRELTPSAYVGLASKMTIQSLVTRNDWKVLRASWTAQAIQLKQIRHAVFVEEQNVPLEEEWDGMDPVSTHLIVIEKRLGAIGTARIMPSGQIGRMAVLSDFRGLGVGAELLGLAVEVALDLQVEEIFLHAQSHAVPFYAKYGFVESGVLFYEADIPHKKMVLDRDSKVFKESQRGVIC